MWQKNDNGRWIREVNGVQLEVYLSRSGTYCILADGNIYPNISTFLLVAQAKAEKIAKFAPWRQ